MSEELVRRYYVVLDELGPPMAGAYGITDRAAAIVADSEDLEPIEQTS